MKAPANVDLDYRSRRNEMRAAVQRNLPHRESYLGFSLGLVATVLVVLTLLGWWMVRFGVVQVWSYPQDGVVDIRIHWR